MRLVFDLEADGLYFEATKIWCICAKDIDTGMVYTWSVDDKITISSFLAYTLDLATELIGHNIIQYDLEVLKKLQGFTTDAKITDTLVLSRLLNPDRRKPKSFKGKGGPHSLECWGYRLGRWKPEHDEWDKFSWSMFERCSEDMEINHLTLTALIAETEGHNWKDAIALEHSTAKIITQQEINGVYFNTEQSNKYVEDLTSTIQEIDKDLLPTLPCSVKQRGATVLNPFTAKGAHSKKYREDISYCSGPFCRITITPFNLGSITDVKNYLLDNGWEPDSWNYNKNTGERSSPKLEGSFQGITGELPKKVKERITLRHRRSQIEGWIKNVRSDHRITAGANTCGTNTGRMRHRTVVNVPKANSDKEGLIWDTSKQKDFFGTQMRSLFCVPPDSDYVMIGHDAAGLELRMLAHYMKDEDYIREILTGDIHSHNQKAAGLPTRDSAKSFIYALNYGAGNEKLGSLAGGGEVLGAKLRREFLKALPSLDRLIKNVKRASSKGYLKGLDGRKVWMRRDPDGKVINHKALNTLLQHSGSILMKKSSQILWEELIPLYPDLDAKKVIDMHDESQAEVNKKDIELYSKLAVQSIVQAGEYYNLRIPMDADVNVGTTWAETH